MTLPELTQPLNLLADSEPQEREVRALFDRVLTLQLDRSSCHGLILDLQSKLDADRNNKKAPYYYIILAFVCFYSAEVDKALFAAEYSANHFNGQGKDLQRAFSRWFRGMLCYKQGDLSGAKDDIQEAVEILHKLNEKSRRLGFYEKKYNDYLDALHTRDETANLALVSRGATLAVRIPKKDFAEVFQHFRPPRSAKLIEDLRRAVHQLNTEDEGQISATASDLSSMLNDLKREKQPPEPFLDAFLAHCLTLLGHTREGQFALALQHNWNAARGFDGGNDLRNHAVSHWYRGLLHLSRGDDGSFRIHLGRAKSLLEELLEKNIANNDGERNLEIEDLIDRIEAALQPGSPQAARPEQDPVHKLANRLRMTWKKRRASTTPRPTRGHTSIAIRRARTTGEPPPPVQVPPTPPPAAPAAGDADEPLIRHLVIPVDVRTIKEVKLDEKIFEADLQDQAGNGDQGGKKNGNGARPKVHMPPPMIIIPSTPYYGHVAAGPNGEPVMPDPSDLQWVEAVDNSHSFAFEGKAYHVTFVHNDRVWLPPNDGQEYGWLKVHGHSMDKAEPLPMQPGDMVLFRVACDLEECVGQIVVAVLPDDETQVPQLVVKRLERTKPSSTGMLTAYELFSESAYKQDPKTGVSYNPIPITRNDQVRGRVVAVAARNQDGAHWVGGD